MITDELILGTEGCELLREKYRDVFAHPSLVQISILFADSLMAKTKDMTPVELFTQHSLHFPYCFNPEDKSLKAFFKPKLSHEHRRSHCASHLR